MENVVTEKAVELVEQKAEEIEKKVEETADKVLDSVQESTQAVADKVEDIIEKIANPIADLIDKDPRVKVVLDGITESIAEQVDGREFSCGCFGWLFALRITRKSRQSSQPKSEETESKPSESLAQHEEAKGKPQSTPLVETQSDPSPSKEASASA